MRREFVICAALTLAACSDGQSNLVSASEPFRIRGAQFFEGALPGSAPSKEPYVDGDPPQIGLSVLSNIVTQGYGGKKISGRLTTNAVSAGLALKGVGSGWWLLPAGDLDSTTTPPSLGLSVTADFSQDIPTGPTFLVAVAMDQAGRAGPQFDQSLCIASSGPAGASACPGGPAVPAAAITLTWDTQADLDLQVLTPDGKLVSPKHPTVEDLEKGEAFDPTKPHIDRDSNANCVVDGVRRESLIWPTLTPAQGTTELPSGLYLVYVNLFSACGQQSANFRIEVSQAVAANDGAAGAGDDDTNMIEHTLLAQTGELVATQASPSAATGLFVAQYEF